MDANALSYQIIGASIEVHKRLGPGMLESAYEECLCRELELGGFTCSRQVPVPVIYRDIKLECGYRLDLLVENTVVVEVKSVEHLAPVHEAQVLTYLRFSDKHLGLLVNVNVKILKEGIRRFIL
jgi:GxxExxY protein